VASTSQAFPVDETALRDWVLKAYHERRQAAGKSKRALDAVRQFLSGAPGGQSVLERYWFEEDPPASVRSFIEDLQRTEAGLARTVLEPLLASVREMEKRKSRTLARNVSVYVASLAGAVAVKSRLDETIASSLIAAAIIGLSRLGRKPFEAALEEQAK